MGTALITQSASSASQQRVDRNDFFKFSPRRNAPDDKTQNTIHLILATMAAVPDYDITLDEMSVALSYVTMALGGAAPAPAAAAAPAKKDNKKKGKKEAKKEVKKEVKKEEDDDDFDVFGDDDEEDDEPQESRKDMLARLKKEAEERTAKKEAKQRTLVGIEIKPWDTEQDLIALWKKITTEVVVMDGLRWAESVNLAEVAFGIKKIQTTFTMGVSQSSQDVQDMIEAMEDEVQSVEIVSMNVL